MNDANADNRPSTIAEFINRFRTDPAAPKNQRNPCDKDFWWNSSDSSNNSNIDVALDFLTTSNKQNKLVTFEELQFNNESIFDSDDTFLSPKPVSVSIIPRTQVQNETHDKFQNEIHSFKSQNCTKNEHNWQKSGCDSDILQQWRIKRAEDIAKYKINSNNPSIARHNYVNFEKLRQKYNTNLNIKPEMYQNFNCESDHVQIPTKYSQIQPSFDVNYNTAIGQPIQKSHIIRDPIYSFSNVNTDTQEVSLSNNVNKNISQYTNSYENPNAKIYVHTNEEELLKESVGEADKQVSKQNRDSSIQTDPPLTKNPPTVTRILIPTSTQKQTNTVKILSNQSSQTNNTSEVQTQTKGQVKLKPDVAIKTIKHTKNIITSQKKVPTTERRREYEIESDDSLWSISSASLEETIEIHNAEYNRIQTERNKIEITDKIEPQHTTVDDNTSIVANSMHISTDKGTNLLDEDELYHLLAKKAEYYEQHVLNITKILATMHTTNNS